MIYSMEVLEKIGLQYEEDKESRHYLQVAGSVSDSDDCIPNFSVLVVMMIMEPPLGRFDSRAIHMKHDDRRLGISHEVSTIMEY